VSRRGGELAHGRIIAAVIGAAAVIIAAVISLNAADHSASSAPPSTGPTVSASASVTASTSASASSPPPGTIAVSATITSPRSGATVPGTLIASGRSAGIGTGYQLWIVVEPSGTSRFFPQQPAATVITNGDWSAPNVAIGRAGDVGRKFLVYAVIATSAAARVFIAYFNSHKVKFPGLRTLPAGTSVVASVTVTRGQG
jgi:hypothetical protein